jgi:hypothetical protein
LLQHYIANKVKKPGLSKAAEKADSCTAAKTIPIQSILDGNEQRAC